jgi:hypothetical protein
LSPSRTLGRRSRGDVYHNLAVYRTDDGNYAVSTQYRTQSLDEKPHDDAMLSRDRQGFAETLADYVPTHVEQRLRRSIESGDRDPWWLEGRLRRYQDQVSALLGHVRDVEEDGLDHQQGRQWS